MHGRRPGMLMITILLFGASSALKAQTPHVVGATPPPQTVSAPPNSDILLTFDTPLDPLTVSDTTVRVYGRWSGPSSGALTLENANTQLRFNPDEDFFYGEWITVALSKSVKSATGQPLASGYYSNFWTWTLKGTLDLEETGRVPVRLNGEGQVQTYGAYAGDFDDDGWSDLAVPNEISADMRVFHNDGAGDYGPFTIYDMPGSSSPSANEGADFDRDGAIDIAIGSGGNNQLTVFFGDGLGGFLAPTNYTAGSSVRGVAVLDMDADGLDDIITANRNASTLTWFRNNGDRTFAGAVTIDPGGFGETACAAADANNDGIADLFVGALNSSDIFLLLGDANGALTVSSQVAAGGRPWMLAVGDVNGDGNVDVVSANSTSNNAAVIFGDGAGGMSAATTYPTGAFTLAIDLGDIDGDGDLDLVTSNFSGNDWALYENDGFGVFGNPRTFPASSSGSCAILHDRDNDGDLDMTGIDETDDLLFIFDNDYRAIRVSADTLFGEAPLDVSFSAETDQTVIAWNWSFGDGDSAQVQSPMHSYQNPGVFTVSASILTADSEFVEILADFIGVYADSLILQSVSGTPGATARMEIYARNFLPQSFIRIPFTWTGALDAVFTGADNSGLRSADMSGAISDIDPFNQRATYTLVAPVDSPLAPGEGPVATLFFRLPDTGAGDTMTVQILPFGSSSPLFVSTFGLYEPLTLPGLVTIACCEVAGDANNDGKVNIADVTFLIARIFASGPAPDCADKANADGAGPVNVADVTYLILRIFAAGPAPVCGNSGL